MGGKSGGGVAPPSLPVITKQGSEGQPSANLYADGRVNWDLMDRPTEVPATPSPVTLSTIMSEASRTVGLFPITTDQIFNAAFADLRHQDDSDYDIGHHGRYEEARVTCAEQALWIHLGLGHGDICIEKAWMSKDIKKNILWVRLKNNDDYLKKVKVHAAVKKPSGLSIRDFCPGIAMDRKKA